MGRSELIPSEKQSLHRVEGALLYKESVKEMLFSVSIIYDVPMGY